MRRPRLRSALVLLVAVHLVLAGCLSPPDWAYFDTEHHPVGAYPSQVGFYAGAYVIFPITYMVLAALGGQNSSPAPSEGSFRVFGTFIGLCVGAPFHLLALPFGGGEDTDADDTGADDADAVEGYWERPPGEYPYR